MRDALRRAAPILATAALLLVAVGLLTPSVPLRAAAEGHDPLALGILGSAYFAGFVAGCLAAPPVIAGLGFRPAYGVLAAIAAALAAALLATGDEAAWLGLRAAGGFALAALYVAIEGALNAEADNATRARVLSVYMIVYLGATLAGQALLAATDPTGSLPFVLIAGLMLASILPLVAHPVARVRQQRVPPLAPHRVWRASPLGAIGIVAVGLCYGAFWAHAPVAAGALAALDPPFGGTMLALVAATGAAMFPLYAVVAAAVSDRVAPALLVAASGGVMLLFSLGAAIGPSLAAPLVDTLGGRGLFAFIAVSLLALAGLAPVVGPAPRDRVRAAEEGPADAA